MDTREVKMEQVELPKFNERSATISELTKAMPKMMGDIKNTANSKSGYGYKYAPLNQILDETRPVLSKAGFSIVQLVSTRTNDIIVKTILMHTSGEYLSSTMEIPPTEVKGTVQIQKMGASITYARRYMLTAMLGIAGEEDTDGVDNSGNKNNYNKPKPKVTKVEPQNKAPDPDKVQVTSKINTPKPKDLKEQINGAMMIIDPLLKANKDKFPPEELAVIESNYESIGLLEDSANKVQQYRDFYVFVKQALRDL